ncbi:MAG TPA: dTDP-4-dehydrorhamnose 3,5-epimerase [Chloroflexota bacterium]|jgi:dTDP-4-dehydrorhamnose 3,5-epimerase|nr:dTDP-4-dehydrorhamnose 3,5-epimerase [Chloroflexota bacterium]
MNFQPTDIEGVVLVSPERFDDERGFFARTWGQDVFEANGLKQPMVQRNLSYNRQSGTLRGMHYQRAPHAEVKLVSCLAGTIFDVAVDLRSDSPTFGKWVGYELRPETGNSLYIPEGCAHGLLTLEPGSVVEYLISAYYAPQAACGVRWDDAFFGIRWPTKPTVMNERDRTYPDFRPD